VASCISLSADVKRAERHMKGTLARMEVIDYCWSAQPCRLFEVRSHAGL
jgi:hypothetical protein